MQEQKNDKRITILTTQDQVDFLKMLSYYSGKSVGEILRFAIKNIDVSNFGAEVKDKMIEKPKLKGGE